MSVTNTDLVDSEVADGIKTAFDFAFKIFAQTDLIVFKETSTGVFALQILTTDYTVIFDSTAETGTVTFVVAPLDTLRAVIIRATARTQGSSFPREGVIPAKTGENALDKLTLIVQEIKERLDRVPLLPQVPPLPDGTDITERIDGRAVKWFKNLTTGKFEMKSSSSDPDDITGTATASGLAAARPVAPTNSILHWYSTDLDQYDVWLLSAGKWFEAVG